MKCSLKMVTPEQNAAIGNDSTSPAVAGEDAVPENMEVLERLLQAEMEERKQLAMKKKHQELKLQLQQLRGENAALWAALKEQSAACSVIPVSAPPVLSPQPLQGLEARCQAQGAVTEQAAGGASLAQDSMSLAELRQRPELVSQVDQIIYRNGNSAAIASPAAAAGVQSRSSASGVFRLSSEERGKEKILLPEKFMHRAGCSELVYERLSIQEFVVGSVRILIQGDILEEKAARLKHLLDIMILAMNCNWPAIRALYGAALRELEKGPRKRSDSLQDLKEEMLKPMDMLSISFARSASKESICKAYDWGREGCTCGDGCTYLHVCEDCAKKRGKKDEPHRGKLCPHQADKEPSASKN